MKKPANGPDIIITENERVLKALEAMQNSQPEILGQLMKESHTSLKEDYEVSRRELDLIVDPFPTSTRIVLVLA